jgi:type VI secretion system protein ImpE
MSAEQELRDGRPAAALAHLQDQVRQDPSSAKLRTFLFQLLSVLGQWDRAMNQLNVAGELDPGTLAMVQVYREALKCESLRAEIFAGHHSPMVLGQPPQWLALLMEALRLGAQGQHGEAERLRSEAFEAAPAISGTVIGEAFDWIADADGWLGPVLEAIVNGRYYWVPFERVREIQIEEPEDLRDLVWLPAHFQLTNEGEAFGLIPSRYPGSEASDDGLIQLGRKTEWQEHDGGLFVGLGQRLLNTEAGDYSILDVRQITLDTQDDTAAEAGAGAEAEAEAPPDGSDG